jgi:4-aminobutyrate aminotransferase-like enzyme
MPVNSTFPSASSFSNASPRNAAHLVNALRAARILISATGAQGHTLKIRPPLVFSNDNAAFFLDRFDSILGRSI